MQTLDPKVELSAAGIKLTTDLAWAETYKDKTKAIETYLSVLAFSTAKREAYEHLLPKLSIYITPEIGHLGELFRSPYTDNETRRVIQEDMACLQDLLNQITEAAV